MKWYIEVMKKYADFSGRARRKEYWMSALVSFLIVLGLEMVAVAGLISGIIGTSGLVIAFIVVLVYDLAILVPSVAVSVRRMHDIGRSGWWILVPVVGLVFTFLDSEPGANKYGPNPKTAQPAVRLPHAA